MRVVRFYAPGDVAEQISKELTIPTIDERRYGDTLIRIHAA